MALMVLHGRKEIQVLRVLKEIREIKVHQDHKGLKELETSVSVCTKFMKGQE